MYKILDSLEDKGIGIFDFLDVLLRPGLRMSTKKFEYEHNKRAEQRLDYQIERESRRKRGLF